MHSRKLSFKAKISYGVATFVMFYFTDIIGISPLFLGGLFFAARLWAAVNDPMMWMKVK